MEDAEDFDVEFVEAVAFEDGHAVAAHSFLDLRQRHRLRRGGRGEEKRQQCQGKGEKSSLHERTNTSSGRIHFDPPYS